MKATLTPYIFSEDARAQAEFYVQALDGEILSLQTFEQMPNVPEEMKNKVMHLSMVAAGIPIFMCDESAGAIRHGGISLSLEFAEESEAHEAFRKLSEGGTVKHPLEQAFWGTLFGQLEDKFGVPWMISTAPQA